MRKTAIMKGKVEEAVLKLIERSKKFKDRLRKLLLESNNNVVTENYLDRQLAKLSEEFNKMLAIQSKEFDEKLAKQSKEFDEKLAKQSKEFDKKLAKQSKEFDEKLAKQSKEFDEKLAKQSKEFDEKLLKQSERFSKELDEKLAKQSKEFDEKLAKLSKEFDEKLTKQSKEFDEKLVILRREIANDIKEAIKTVMKYIDNKTSELGSRWGMGYEYSFREGLKDFLEKKYKSIVKKWVYTGKIPEISQLKEQYEIDVVVSNGDIYAFEIKSSISVGDVFNFVENSKAYEYINKVKIAKKIMISTFTYPKAKEIAKQYDIEITSPPDEYYWSS